MKRINEVRMSINQILAALELAQSRCMGTPREHTIKWAIRSLKSARGHVDDAASAQLTLIEEDCSQCSGSGQYEFKSCGQCNGEGWVVK
jgi:DnaJ-class molecular chaperone